MRLQPTAAKMRSQSGMDRAGDGRKNVVSGGRPKSSGSQTAMVDGMARQAYKGGSGPNGGVSGVA